jgi:hypothetical protein
LNAIRRYLAAVPGSIAGHVNREELVRAIVASGALSSLGMVALAALEAVSADASAIFPRPRDAYYATLGLGLVLDLVRRMGHCTPPPAA